MSTCSADPYLIRQTQIPGSSTQYSQHLIFSIPPFLRRTHILTELSNDIEMMTLK
ncbi:889_t:CDS:2 [Funneliformis mosseae]|uniref:889_t:CDS:1 n=1 Tax=Funneliformis mosseae TaxID=27381 RepID=A0A9N9A202_FUNMO|nr:889_t:CDS:2 [Funneliformis mosseae]